MKVNFGNVQRLVLKHGPVDARDASGTIKRIEDDPESIDAVNGAEAFRFHKVWYSRPEFRTLLEAKLNTPSGSSEN